MNKPARIAPREEGFVLAVVVVFIVILSLSAFLVAGLTRTDLRVVTNVQNEKEAFYYAEAGITETQLRLRQASTGATATVDGLAFPYEIVPDETAPGWKAQITFTSAAPGTVSGVFITPTLQTSTSRMPYSDVTGGPELPLEIAWVLASPGTIRELSGRKVLEVRSTGQSGSARRTVSVQMLEVAGCAGGGLCTLSDTCSAVYLQGQADVTFSGGVTINSSCTPNALDLGSNTTFGSDSGIDVVGGYDGQGTVAPAPNEGAESFADPLAGLGYPTVGACTANNAQFNGSATLSPGVYCGGIRFGGTGTITLQPGLYVIAGGQLTTSGTPNVRINPSQADPGVTFFITQHPSTGQWGSVDFGPGNANLIAPAGDTNGGIPGILVFQHRNNANELVLRGTFVTGLDGLIYAANANVDIQDQGGGAKNLNVGLIVGSASFTGDARFNNPTHPVPAFGTPMGYQSIAWKDW